MEKIGARLLARGPSFAASTEAATDGKPFDFKEMIDESEEHEEGVHETRDVPPTGMRAVIAALEEFGFASIWISDDSRLRDFGLSAAALESRLGINIVDDRIVEIASLVQ